MERKINLENIISSIEFYDYTSLNKMVNLIIESNNTYYFIEDELEKVIDVTQMPSYIQLDWFKYNKKELTLSIVNKHIKYLKDSIEDLYTKNMSIQKNIEVEQQIQQVLEKVFLIRRDLIINGIL
jgi:hypothetical protein